MRQTEFRGKRIEGGEWVYGHLLETPLTWGDHGADSFLSGTRRVCIAIEGGCVFEVDPDTVGQYTHALDKKENDIYEGDIVKETKPYGDFYHQIRWSDWNSGFWVGTSSPLTFAEAGFCEVIGNIHENPELLNPKK